MLAALQVIHAIAERLRTFQCSWAPESVHTSRAWPLNEGGLPAWRIFPGPESIEPQTVHANPTLQHELDVVLEGVVRQVSELDELMASMASQALELVFAVTPPSDSLAALTGRLVLQPSGIQRIPATEGEAAIGRVLITLSARFRTKAAAPDTIL